MTTIDATDPATPATSSAPGPRFPGRKRGRKSLLTPEIAEKLAEHIEHGALIMDACAHVGISNATYFGWMEKGRNQTEGPYFDFAQMLDAATAAHRSKLLRHIDTAAKTDWRAAAWTLERGPNASKFAPQIRVSIESELQAGLDRLEKEFANEPEILERALAALSGQHGGGAPHAKTISASASRISEGTDVHPDAPLPAATPVPRARR